VVGLSDDEVKGFWVDLSIMKRYIQAPMVLTMLVAETKSIWFYERLNFCHEGKRKIKRLTRMNMGSLVDPYVGEKADDPTADSYDVVTMSRELTQLSAKLAQCNM
jgi:hypothetical protein